MDRLNRAVTRYPWATILAFLLVTALLGAGIPSLEIELDVRASMPQDHPEVMYNDWVEDYFGISDPAVVMIINDGPDGIFTPETLRLVQVISEAVENLHEIRKIKINTVAIGGGGLRGFMQQLADITGGTSIGVGGGGPQWPPK